MFRFAFTPSALDDIAWFRVPQRKAILQGIEEQLAHEPGVETRNRKRLRPNSVAEWELRVGEFRVFYDVDTGQNTVEIKTAGIKEGNVLRVRGKEFRL